ncbi:pentapeptide repeat-containing protein [Methylobacterium sp. J-092]|uniref:pentapeptide repeat-containing protein n=1 Tax=Methylobacterium sp. J-092 TaxID=2836667 RepID=UPI001FBA1C57|nr:pentapeptide repeat-containing protein [Methylobacterium sp. J-092]MCJ2008603.1 pentapeptide repeat-containing protein [Methylobacterium sp. J-092]
MSDRNETPLPRAADAPLDARTEAVLDRIAAAGSTRFGTGEHGLDLVRIDAAGATLAQRIDPEAPAPAWWDPECGGLNLADAVLDRARMEGANLSAANLRRANLSGAVGRSATFAGANLEEADLGEADLSGTDFRGIVAGQASFREAMLEDARFDDAALRFAKFPQALLDGANFSGADLWGADFTGADADDTSFKGARLDEADLSDVNLTHADFEGASLTKARLVGSRLRGANLSNVKLDGADLSGADLSETSLVRLNFVTCKLHHARFAGAWLNGTRMRIEQLGGMVGEEAAGDYAGAQASYLALEQNLKSIGSHDEASWAYKRGRRMGRFEAGEKTRAAWTARDGRAFLRHGYRWTSDRFVEWLCDYGESLSRIARAFAILIVVFAVLFGFAGGLIPDGSTEPTRNAVDWLSYSALNMMTANPPEIGVKPIGRFTNLLVGIEGAAGIILMGLYGFVLGNRLRR